MRLRHCLFLLLLNCLFHIAHGETDSLSVRNDLSAFSPRVFQETTLKRYQADPLFQYQEEFQPLTWWQKVKTWFYTQLNRLFDQGYRGKAFRNLLIGLGVIGLAFMVYKLLDMDFTLLFDKKSPVTRSDDPPQQENIHAIAFEEELQKALGQANFRQAVRLLYLQCLKELTDRQLIDWQPGKTNRIYLQELREKSFCTDFTLLTGKFEYVWYGGFPLGTEEFGHIQQDFSSFHQQLKQERA